MKIERIAAGIIFGGALVLTGCSYNNLYRPKGERAAGNCSEERITLGTLEGDECLQKNNHPKYDKNRNFLK